MIETQRLCEHPRCRAEFTTTLAKKRFCSRRCQKDRHTAYPDLRPDVPNPFDEAARYPALNAAGAFVVRYPQIVRISFDR